MSPELAIKKKPWTYLCIFFYSGAPAWAMTLDYKNSYKSSKLAF